MQEIMACVRQELGLAQIGALGLNLGLLQLGRKAPALDDLREQRLVQLLERGSALIDAALEFLLGRFQDALRAAALVP